MYVCVCVVLPFTLDVTLVDAPAEDTQEEGPTGFLPRRIQPSLSLVDREVYFFVTTNKSFSTCWAWFLFMYLVFARKSPSLCDCTEIRTDVPTSEGFEVTN